MPQSQLQLGKNGVTENFLSTLRDHFKKHDNVKISVLKSAGHTKERVRTYSEEILAELGEKYTAKILGFVISIRKWRRKVR